MLQPDQPEIPACSDDGDGRWNLDVLYTSLQDPKIEADRASARRLAEGFAARYRGRITQLDGPGLRAALEDFEVLMRVSNGPNHYCSLRFAVATDDEECQAAQARSRAFDAEIDQIVAFFPVELKAIDAAAIAAMPGSEALAPYAHYLQRQQGFAPYTLSEDAEQTVARKDVTGKSAWVQFYTQLTSSFRYRIERDGEEQFVTRGELRPLRTHPDRDLRNQSVQAVVDAFEPHRSTVNFVFNTLFEDHGLEMKARGSSYFVASYVKI